MNKIIAVDFDNTLFVTNWPAILRPIWPVIRKVQEEQANGAKIILWTCRTGKELDIAVDVCEKVGIHFDAINDNVQEAIDEFGGDSRKIFAHEYWDDLSWNPVRDRPGVIAKDASVLLMSNQKDFEYKIKEK